MDSKEIKRKKISSGKSKVMKRKQITKSSKNSKKKQMIKLSDESEELIMELVKGLKKKQVTKSSKNSKKKQITKSSKNSKKKQVMKSSKNSKKKQLIKSSDEIEEELVMESLNNAKERSLNGTKKKQMIKLSDESEEELIMESSNSTKKELSISPDKKQFMYLMPGNWFDLKNINYEKTYPYDIKTLSEEVVNQVNNRSEKLSDINLSFSSHYSTNTIRDIIFHLDTNRFNKMADLLNRETRHPIITFHGTTNRDTVESILAHGYIIPGSKIGDKIIRGVHGAAYGTGIYSSSHFGKAMMYTRPDGTKTVYVLINMIFLGVMKLIPPGCTPGHDMPANGFYQDGSNTRIVYGLEQLISADPNRIIPVAVMTINIA